MEENVTFSGILPHIPVDDPTTMYIWAAVGSCPEAHMDRVSPGRQARAEKRGETRPSRERMELSQFPDQSSNV